MSHSMKHWRREKLSSMVTGFVADVKAGRHREQGWPNTCYGMSKLSLIAYSNVRARGLPLHRTAVLATALPLLAPYNASAEDFFRLLSGRRGIWEAACRSP